MCLTRNPSEEAMQLNVYIDDELLSTALRRSGLETVEAVIEEGLRALISLCIRTELEDMLDVHFEGTKPPSSH